MRAESFALHWFGVKVFSYNQIWLGVYGTQMSLCYVLVYFILMPLLFDQEFKVVYTSEQFQQLKQVHQLYQVK